MRLGAGNGRAWNCQLAGTLLAGSRPGKAAIAGIDEGPVHLSNELGVCRRDIRGLCRIIAKVK